MAENSLAAAASDVAASAHVACARFRGTDPLLVGRTRRQLAAEIGYPDESGRIPAARWMRAVTFEHLVRTDRFASELATTTVGRLGLNRPTDIVTADAHDDADKTAGLLADAHARAVSDGSVTLLHSLALPFAAPVEHPEDGAAPPENRATLAESEVESDLAVIAPEPDAHGGSWLILGAAKDYERVRSRIEDARLLKGFLRVALAAESARTSPSLPTGMSVHSHGVLAVPRNAFLQPEALVEALDDHRAEVRMRLAERQREFARSAPEETADLAEYVAHLRATFDPASCTSCTLFSYCREELRASDDPTDLLVELGIPPDTRPQLVGLVDGTGETGNAPASAVANVSATLDGLARPTGQRRVDQAGRPGTIDLVLAKSDSAVLGIHGIALRRVTAHGPEPWRTAVFDEPQSAWTRHEVMHLLGRELSEAMAEQRSLDEESPGPVHLVLPDQSTADVLVSIADNLAGIELSGLRWRRDELMGRTPLTFDGEPAEIPHALPETARTAVSFLLEEDRARALTLRSPIIVLRESLARHVVAGGPPVASYRLDYLVRWAETVTEGPVKPRELEDEIEAAPHTPGARLTSGSSDAIHEALTGADAEHADPEQPDSGRSGPEQTRTGRPDSAASEYATLVTEELDYKRGILDRALTVLHTVPDSLLRRVHREIEADAQAVWRRRLAMRASDLVRFGRTHRFWRNALVEVIESDDKCRSQLRALSNPQFAEELATDVGTREVAVATVVSVRPLVLDVASRRIRAGSRIVLLHVNGESSVEHPDVELVVQKSNFKFAGLSIGPLSDVDDPETPRRFAWKPENVPELAVGDRLLVADFAWFSTNKGNASLSVARPRVDNLAAPEPACEAGSYAEDPETHERCCRPHEDVEAEWSDRLAERRARGELNPEVWPPIADSDAFEVAPSGAPVGDPTTRPVTFPPDGMTLDELE
ncbi:hypothetical protein SAMN04487820_108218 [Actinopolyspora mzabensis]|uniref:Uncharacterized protein n=1 Tax=Actinopolyspora mzabensis TaxID=995066 RepID=A0A1G9CAX3_ACTMZ|nr:hypothetical protein [Actinopolyspora mzabensis]SDK48776.1 hypothetical protein SAMN04487820_108218 [Actinopolyspora mzabensis]